MTGMFTRNLPTKMAALVLAILVWFTVRQNLTSNLTRVASVRTDLAPGLMLTGPVPPTVKVEFQGPTSQINLLKRQDAAIHLLVKKDDLNGALTGKLKFSPERRNVLHRYGPDVRIVSMYPPEISLDVAVRGSKKVAVREPDVRLTLTDWTVANHYLATKEVSVTGPQAILDTLKRIVPPPVNADEILAGKEEETYGPVELTLRLPADLRKEGVELASGETIRFGATFSHSGISKTFRVPLLIFYQTANPTKKLTLNANDLVKPTDAGFDIGIEFRGTDANLARLSSAVNDHSVWAYILAREYPAEISRGSPPRVYVHIPDYLWGRITEKPIDPTKIDIQATEREKK